MPNSIAEQLKIADIRVDNSLLNADVKAAVAVKGYTEEELLKGKDLVNAARDAVKKQVTQEGTAQEATAAEEACKQEAHKVYQDFSQTARAKWPANSPMLVKLGLTGPMPRTTANFIKAGYILFDNAKDPEILAEISKNGYNEEKLTEDRARIENYEKANKNQVTAIGDSQKATEEQQDALSAMNKWISEYTKIAKVALREDEKLLNKIGVIIKKRGPHKKKNTIGNNPS